MRSSPERDAPGSLGQSFLRRSVPQDASSHPFPSSRTSGVLLPLPAGDPYVTGDGNGDSPPPESGLRPTDPPLVAQVPDNLPSAKDHPVVLVSGLQQWFGVLDIERRRLFLRYLYDFDPDTHSPAPGLYLQPVSNYRLAACYDMSTAAARTEFVHLVAWRGLVDVPRTPSLLSSADRGFCYLDTVTPAARGKMRSVLGHNPWGPSVAAYLLSEPGVWTPSTLVFTSGLPPLDPTGPAYVQGHISVSSGGMRVKALIPLLAGWMRVGAATGDRMALLSDGPSANAPSKHTLFDEPPSGARMPVTLGIYADFGSAVPIVWSPFATPSLVLMLGMYESVRLESVDLSVTVPSGASYSVYCGITRVGVPVKATEWFTMPYLKIVNGSDQGSVVSNYRLPERHSFNPELRAATSGNGPPEFKFGLAGPAGQTALLLGSFTVSVAGQVVMHSIDIGPKSKSVTSVRAVQRTLPYVVTGHRVDAPASPGGHPPADDSEEESDDDDEPARPSPTSQSGSPSRTR